MTRAWSSLSATDDKPAARQRLKDLVWSNAEPYDVRATAVNLLASDPDPAGVDDTRQMVKLILPREPSRGMVAMLSTLCAERGWQDATTALVRSYSRTVDAVDEMDRSERAALVALNPDQPPLDIAFGVFLNPAIPGGAQGEEADDFARRSRGDAWAVVARLDPTGGERRRLLATTASPSPDVALMRQCAQELAALPNTAAEIAWVQSLYAPASAENRGWREQVAPLVARLGDAQRERLALRHLEPIRWAAANRPEWLSTTRDELLSALASQLDGRPVFQRRVERDMEGGLRTETLTEQRHLLSWGDALSVLVIDEAINDPAFLDTLWTHLDQDRADRTTEYGGLLQHVARAGGIRPLLFIPRSAAREGDLAFPESPDMVRQGDRSLSVYHFHASESEMLDHAGPSAGDLAYARLNSRNCVVFTSLRQRRVAVDYYNPDGVVIDLGELPR